MSFGLEHIDLVCNGSGGQVVYYGQERRKGDGSDRVVIGYSTRGPYARLGEYKNSARIYLVAWEPAPSMELERRRHRDFYNLRVPGLKEWFMPGKRLMDWIQRLKEKHGRPEPFWGKYRGNGKPDDRYKRLIDAYGYDIVRAVWDAMCIWWDQSRHPGADSVLRECKPEHEQMYRDVIAQYCARTGCRAVQYEQMIGADIAREVTFDVLADLRRGTGGKNGRPEVDRKIKAAE